jgi:cation diffusion facilitator family transporter
MTSRRLSPQQRARETRRVLQNVLALNLAVVVIKAAAFAGSGALSLLAEVFHSALDAANNIFALWLARLAGQGPDAEHPYGHQKFETLGALVLVGMLSITVFELGRSAVLRLTGRVVAEVTVTPWTFGLLGLGIATGLAITAYESRRGRALGSDLLLADAAHTRADVYTSLAVLAGLVLVRAGYPAVDPWVTLVVALAIAHTGWEVVRDAVPVLVDERAEDADRIRALAEEEPDVVAAYHIRSRGRPGEVYAELTISVDPAMDVVRSHAVADAVERALTRHLGALEVVVHVEPAG